MQGKQTVRGMFQSMAVICAAAAVIYLFVPHDENADPLKAVDYSVEIVTAQRAAPYPVAAPEGLPEGWRATSVSFRREEGHAWHLGYLTPEREYVAVEQSTADPKRYIGDVSHGAEATGETQQVGGRAWERWEGDKYDALVLRDKGATTVVLGTAPFEQLGMMAAALTSAQPAPSGAPGSAPSAAPSGAPGSAPPSAAPSASATADG
ncbi:DUF4245 domain-containing protein [Streptomyces sp. CC228A]|uniref:DUF4245 domain-containing protein n=1 Tax=Streptomyces sp. CC228A TaxID=2898186 RepID=UPI0022A8A0B6|nr:DUF4245 domain-containing protein [Streptomyces sp. CC228A]